ncbi:MAG: hypothetical protein MJA31_20460 [Clostridia bacterium]|nr:hypothetical protein [Clostridia bacterium]
MEQIGKIIQNTCNQSLPEVEKQLNFNFNGLKWEVEHTEELRTMEGLRVKIYMGVTSPFGGVTFTSFFTEGGGYTAFYIKLTENEDKKTDVFVLVTGAERITGDWGERNETVASLLIEMCEKDCTNTPLKEKMKNFFSK